MKDRCYNPHNKYYKDYGQRGIIICPDWLSKNKKHDGWKRFKEWALNNGYNNNLSIDRIDNNKGYSPDNCRWVTEKKQANNRRSNIVITYRGKTQTLTQWCDDLKLDYKLTRVSIRELHWSIKDAFEFKNNPRLRLITYKCKTQSLSCWCKELNLNYDKVIQRIIRLKWPIVRAFQP
jgi:hypothetical protein